MLRLLFAALLLCSSTAQAEEPTEEPSFFDKTDAAFAEHVVGPLASVLFFDIAFWDNSLTKGDGLGETVGDERVVDWSEDDGYVFQQVLRAPVAELEARVTGEIEVTDEVTALLGPLNVWTAVPESSRRHQAAARTAWCGARYGLRRAVRLGEASYPG